MSKAIISEATQVLWDGWDEKRKLDQGEAHVLMEMEETDDSVELTIRIAANVNAEGKILLVARLMEQLQLSPLELYAVAMTHIVHSSPRDKLMYEEIWPGTLDRTIGGGSTYGKGIQFN